MLEEGPPLSFGFALIRQLDVQAHSLRSHYQHLKRKQEQYSEEHGTDPDELSATVLFVRLSPPVIR